MAKAAAKKTVLEEISTDSAADRNASAAHKTSQQIQALESQLLHLKAELDAQKALNKQLHQGETQEDIDQANKYMEAINNKGFKPGMTWYEFYDRRLEKKDRSAPRHRAPLDTPPGEGQQAIQEEWARRTGNRWGGEGEFPWIFTPIEPDADAEAA